MHFIDSKFKINLTSIFALRVAAGQIESTARRSFYFARNGWGKCTFIEKKTRNQIRENKIWRTNIEIIKMVNNGKF